MRYEDLPAKLRARVDEQIGRQPKTKRSRRVASSQCEWRCTTCGQLFTVEAEIYRHEHRRIEIVLHTTRADAVASAGQPNEEEPECPK